jgi:hypothetical protein
VRFNVADEMLVVTMFVGAKFAALRLVTFAFVIRADALVKPVDNRNVAADMFVELTFVIWAEALVKPVVRFNVDEDTFVEAKLAALRLVTFAFVI